MNILKSALCLMLAMLLTACSSTPPKYQASEVAMDTVIQVIVYDKNAEQVTQKVFAELNRLDALLNSYSEQSEVGKINKNAGQAVKVSADTLALVNRALLYAKQTNGLFDPTIGSVSRLWAIGKKGEFVPTSAELKQALALVDYRQVEVDQAQSTVKLMRTGMILDLGGVAKGYILERMLNILKDNGVKSALVNGGGDVLTLGQRGDGGKWRIGVQDPRKPDGMLKVLDMDKYNQASTSGDYQRYFIKDGVRYHHVFDPRTGYPSKGMIAATIIGRHEQIDIPSNVLMVMGEVQALEFIKTNYPSLQVILVDHTGRVIEYGQ